MLDSSYIYSRFYLFVYVIIKSTLTFMSNSCLQDWSLSRFFHFWVRFNQVVASCPNFLILLNSCANLILLRSRAKFVKTTGWLFSLVPPLKGLSTEKLIWARLGVSRTIYVNVDSPNLGFPYFNFLGGTSEKITLYMFTFWRSQIDKLCQLIQKKYVNILCVVFSQSPPISLEISWKPAKPNPRWSPIRLPPPLPVYKYD